jgi:protein-tyrosine kinase
MEAELERADNFVSRTDHSTGTMNEVHRQVVTLTAPASAAAEQYRSLYYRLERLREMRPLKVVALTSALPGEGKTVTTVNLALAAARANPDRSILLIDADLRRSQVGEYLGIRSRPGLAELVAGDCEVGDAVRRFKSTRLAIIPAGGVPEEPAYLLAGNRMKSLMHAMREGFDEVYIDLPPILPFADASILACQSDGVVMVVRAHVTSQKRVTEAVEQLAGAPLLGCVLNGVEPSAPYLKSYL